MNILNAIRRNWLWLTLCLLLFTISCSRKFGHHPLSWWNVCWIFAPLTLIVWAGGNDWIIFRPLRWWQWPAQKSYIETKLVKLKDNSMVYPILVWLEFNGQQAYIRGGIKGLEQGLFLHGLPDSLERAVDKVTKALKSERDNTPAAHHCTIADPCPCGEKPAHIRADCGNAGCGCG